MSRRAAAGPPKSKQWAASTIAQRALSTLLPYAQNARTHSEQQVRQIAGSIREFGFVNPVLVDEGGEIIAGHGRVLASQSLGLERVPVIVRAGLTDAQKRALRLADNKLALNAGWDDEMLASELALLRDVDAFEMDLLGFDTDEIDRLLAGAEPAAAAPPPPDLADDTPDDADQDVEPPRQRVTRTGDLWLLGDHRLLCGDSTSEADVARLIAGQPVALLFTSPPYGQQRNYTTGGIGDWDKLMQGVFRHAAAAVAPAGQILVNLGLIHRESEWLPYWDHWLEWMRTAGWRRFGLYVWDQGPALPGDWNGRFGPSFEFMFHFNREARRPNKIVESKWAGHVNSEKGGLRNKEGNVGTWTAAGEGVQPFRIPDNVVRITRHKQRGIEVEHPAVFPVKLPEFIIHSFTNPGETVLEPFSGSGTTILAAQRAGRAARAMELGPEYVDLAVARWRLLHPDIPVTLEGDGRTFDQIAQERTDG